MQYIDPFVRAAHRTLEQILGTEPVNGDVQPLAQQFLMEQCNLSIGITGAIQGTVVYGFSLVTADRIASKMLGTTIRTFDAIAASAMAEMCNMITMSALDNLIEVGLECQATPSTMLRGTGSQLSMLTVPAVGSTVRTTVGELHITAGLEQHLSFALRT
jgi:chemotaxis protein CheX